MAHPLRDSFASRPRQVLPTTIARDAPRGGRALHGSCPRRTSRMLTGQEFATCSDDEFRAYIIGWTFAWSGIIPYTIIAAKVRTIAGGSIELVVFAHVSNGRCRWPSALVLPSERCRSRRAFAPTPAPLERRIAPWAEVEHGRGNPADLELAPPTTGSAVYAAKARPCCRHNEFDRYPHRTLEPGPDVDEGSLVAKDSPDLPSGSLSLSSVFLSFDAMRTEPPRVRRELEDHSGGDAWRGGDRLQPGHPPLQRPDQASRRGEHHRAVRDVGPRRR